MGHPPNRILGIFVLDKFAESVFLSVRKIQTDFLTAEKVNKGHGRLETRKITTSEMLMPIPLGPDFLKSIGSNVTFNGSVLVIVIIPLAKPNGASRAWIEHRRARYTF